jgi:hypothetical protein
MKTLKSGILAILILALEQNGQAQGFVNLNFESAKIVPVSGDPYGRVESASAFPGWTCYTGTTVETLALYDNLFLDSSGIGIVDNNSSFGLIQGQYTAMLEAGLALGTSQPANTTLSQTAVVPAGTQSLLFDAIPEGDANSFAVTLNGQTLSLILLSSASGYDVYGADIQSWANQTATLSFTVFAQQPHVDNNILYLDDIQFSTSSVPEPSILGLSALGGLFLAWRCWSRKTSGELHHC